MSTPPSETSVAYQRQYQELLDLARKDGYTDVTVIETKTPSGKPQYESLMKAIESGEYGAIYVYSLSRISHQAIMLRSFFDVVDKTETELKVATMPGLSEASPLHRDILAGFMERDLDCSIRARRGTYRGKVKV